MGIDSELNKVKSSRRHKIVVLWLFQRPKVMQVALFKCDWVDVTKGRGVKDDELGFTLSSIQSDLTDLSLLEIACVQDNECDDWVRSADDGIVTETDIHSLASTNDGEANAEGGNDSENESDS
ncbi:hypothetical protein KY290_007903 [Solanum tuberosum]|uniref:Uncharacterized protein n=1 Tax=Solanum tuberosum TaxID=4113 RepID=A0ABQ7W9L4_SOLTU|nr:hypothetical protein KY290_007903 [Solanum tuberosum]